MNRVRTCVVGVAALIASPAAADPVEDFYKGKTFTFVSGYPPGGGYDSYARIFGRHFGRFLPGKPTVVVNSMPGAGSMVAANYLYNTAPADGTQIGLFGSSVLSEPAFGNQAARFDPMKYSWLGSMAQDVSHCGMWAGPGVPTTFAEMFTKKSIIGGGAPAAVTYQHPMVLKNVLGVNIDVVAGYPGSREINLAMARGEVNGTCALYTSSINTQYGDDVKSGRMVLVVQMGAKKMNTFGDIPSVYDFAKTEEQKQLLDAHFTTVVLADHGPTRHSGRSPRGVAQGLHGHDEGSRIPRRGAEDRRRDRPHGPRGTAGGSGARGEDSAGCDAESREVDGALSKSPLPEN